MPGGASGVALKSKFPKMAAWAEREGLRLEDLTRLRVRTAWGRSLSYSAIGNFGSHVDKPAIRWFLKVLIALSAELCLCRCGGTS